MGKLLVGITDLGTRIEMYFSTYDITWLSFQAAQVQQIKPFVTALRSMHPEIFRACIYMLYRMLLAE